MLLIYKIYVIFVTDFLPQYTSSSCIYLGELFFTYQKKGVAENQLLDNYLPTYLCLEILERK